MVKVNGATAIRQKITEFNQQITHFEQCICLTKLNIDTLQNALVVLEFDPISLLMQKQKGKMKSKAVKNHKVTAAKSPHYPSQFIVKVFKDFPNEWLSAKDITDKAIKIAKYTLTETDIQTMTRGISQRLRRLHNRGIVERKTMLIEKTKRSVIQWRLKSIEQVEELSNYDDLL
ncbi:hypothetical protein EV694_0459 [Volucribacter psittacicida]|uniref:Uncharacterized protein n=1 Tax=Volucribacter psittacicida TaxID=203482 RepID=A0A4R1G5R6_9PAST|nr:hypothetical protein [Volucribacter psittacicida]TCK01825.1 hypothetical protein EV694_0459 [Volucribacter psittacicida]